MFFAPMTVDYILGVVGPEMGMLELHMDLVENYMNILTLIAIIAISLAYLRDRMTGYVYNCPLTTLTFVLLLCGGFVIAIILSVFSGLIITTLYPMAHDFTLVQSWSTDDIIISFFTYIPGIVLFGGVCYGVLIAFRTGREALIGE